MYQLSIVIPIYNVENYLQECLNSIGNSIDANVEVILVNDGSTDNSKEIAREFQNSRKNVVLIEQENKGLSIARNVGLNAAQGEYILFLDSDDYLASNAISNLLNILNESNLDLLLFSGYKVYYDRERIVEEKPFGYSITNMDGQSGLKMFQILQQNGEYSSCVVLQCVKRAFLNENHIRFYPGILHEDHLYTFYVFMNAKKCGVIPNKYYYYRQRSGSIMYSGNKGYKNNFIGMTVSFCAMVDWYLEYAKDKIDRKYCIWILKHLHDMREWTIWKYYLLTEKEMEDVSINKMEYEEKCYQLRKSNPYRISIIVLINDIKDSSLEVCFESLASQNIEGYEVIICSNGKEANKIAEKYVKTYSEIFSYHVIAEGGYNEIRNKALDVAEGEYVYFINGDVKFKPDALSLLLDKMTENKLDMLWFTSEVEDICGRAGIEILIKFLQETKACNRIENLLVQRELIEKNGIRFSVNCLQGEELYLFAVMLYAKRVGCTESKIYFMPICNERKKPEMMCGCFPEYAAIFCEMVRLYKNVEIKEKYSAYDADIRDYVFGYEKACFDLYKKERSISQTKQYDEWIRMVIKRAIRFNRGKEYWKQVLNIVR